MRELAHMHVLIALMRDGFQARSPGGSVGLESDGTPVLDYRLDEFFWEGARRAFASMAEIQFAAGAKTVMPLHSTAASYSSWPAAKAGIGALALEPLKASVVSAHVMGGCPLGPDPRRAVTDPSGRHHHLENLYVFDGSLFPTSVGANPQLSIYGVTAKLATELAARLKPARLG
jgi:choline dehydrogenase-like flavoprotein